MKIIKQGTVPTKDFPKQIECLTCQAILEITEEDINTATCGDTYIECLCCKNRMKP